MIAADNVVKKITMLPLEEDLYQQMGLMKLDDLDFLPMEVVKQMIENKLGKRVMDSNDVGEEIINENVNNVIQRPSFYGCVEDWYDGIDEEVKITLRSSESPTRMFRQLCQYIELEFIGPRADPNEKRMEYQRKLSNLSICNMKYVDNYIMEFETYYYKICENETNLGMFYDKLPSSLNEEISENYQEWRNKFLARDALVNRIAFLKKWIEKKCREVAGTQ
ncbi:uncharacterized protein LOC110694576 [Chenopodium quinoa]|uniref:uncharacterized protein LOC110694576 n=1 Tax=Chenopodium quinoa TaxID=63459 RepID=UPI000B7729F4|nr:uncharacterized protein LOC110694576 [Chenopodium quinoa]